MSLKQQVVDELHKPARRHFERRPVIIKGLNDLFQADLVEMLPYARVNKGYRYILVVINAFSKYVWAYPVKRKTGQAVVDAMKKVLSFSIPHNLQTDNGKEFYNKEFRLLMQKFNINHYSTFSSLKSSIVERVNRTLKNAMWKQFSLQGTYKWLEMLPTIVTNYNATKHRTIGLRPMDVTKKDEKHLLTTVYSNIKVIDQRKAKFAIGDSVRISKFRHAFGKGYTPNWSNEIFTVSAIRHTNPRTYYLQDESKESIKGGFYNHELQKVKHPDIYLVERILKRKADKVFVKWLGLSNAHNSWISKTNIV